MRDPTVTVNLKNLEAFKSLVSRSVKWLELLKELEHCMPDKTCPVCGWKREHIRPPGHSETCRLGKALYGDGK